jgi:hypothetical protein
VSVYVQRSRCVLLGSAAPVSLTGGLVVDFPAAFEVGLRTLGFFGELLHSSFSTSSSLSRLPPTAHHHPCIASPAQFSILSHRLCRPITQLVSWHWPHHFGVTLSGGAIMSEYAGHPIGGPFRALSIASVLVSLIEGRTRIDKGTPYTGHDPKNKNNTTGRLILTSRFAEHHLSRILSHDFAARILQSSKGGGKEEVTKTKLSLYSSDRFCARGPDSFTAMGDIIRRS